MILPIPDHDQQTGSNSWLKFGFIHNQDNVVFISPSLARQSQSWRLEVYKAAIGDLTYRPLCEVSFYAQCLGFE
ncbi:MAG: hypothetical protein Q7V32_07205 [Methylicorpusculum sp.]|nr:hypothetical protein [Methylicorpusculum sp.]